MKTILTFGLAALLASPALAQTCQLAGTITGLGTRPAEYIYTQHGQRLVDTVRVVNDHFALVARASDDGMGMVRFSSDSHALGFLPFWVEPGTLHVQGTTAQLNQLEATGTPENNLLSAYNHAVPWKPSPQPIRSAADYQALETRQAQETRQFIQAHPTARTSAYLLYEQMQRQPSYPVADYEKLTQALTPAVRQSWYGQAIAKRLDVLRNQPTVGRPVANFSMADTAGVQHSLAAYRGQYVLLDFWGHWCGPCIRSMPKVSTLHQQYAGKLAVIGIAMENADDVSLWKQAIRQHHVPGLQLSELQSDEGPVITGYNINAYPTYLLLDRQGRLVARANDVDDIAQKMAALTDL